MTGANGILITCAHWIHLFSLEYHGLGFVYCCFYQDSFKVICAMQLKPSATAINYINILFQNTTRGTAFSPSPENTDN